MLNLGNPESCSGTLHIRTVDVVLVDFESMSEILEGPEGLRNGV